MIEQVAYGRWRQIKGEIQKAWGRLTNEELEKAKGDWDEITRLIQLKYGHSEPEINKRLKELTSRYTEKFEH